MKLQNPADERQTRERSHDRAAHLGPPQKKPAAADKKGEGRRRAPRYGPCKNSERARKATMTGSSLALKSRKTAPNCGSTKVRKNNSTALAAAKTKAG